MAIAHSTGHDSFGHWLSGFVDGEGCFILIVHAAKRFKTTIPCAKFEIHLRQDDQSILADIRRFLGVGVFYDRTSRLTPGSHQKSKPQICYRVAKASDLVREIIPHFETYPLRAKKKNDFAIWKRGVELLHRIQQRQRRVVSHRGGTLPKWTIAERAEFESLVSALKEQRKFESSGNGIPLDPPPRSNGSTQSDFTHLFD